MNKPKAILFDFGNTLLHEVNFDPEKGNEFLFSIIKDRKGVDYSSLLEHINKLNKDLLPKKDVSSFEVSWVAFNKMFFEYFDLMLPISHEEAELEFWERSESWELAPGIKNVLDYIKELNIPMAVVSNSAFSGKMLEYELEKQGIRKHFEFIMASSDYGLRKPHPYLFELAASKIKAFTNDIWFIGDSIEKDVMGSRNVGMTSFHYIGKKKQTSLPMDEVINCWENFIPLLK